MAWNLSGYGILIGVRSHRLLCSADSSLLPLTQMNIGSHYPCFFDLSEPQKLKDTEFHIGAVNIGWIIETQAAKPRSSQRIMIHEYSDMPSDPEETAQE